MNVENRKLFRNKDARARLAGMGGIIASSPELLGTVQKFSNGSREVVQAQSRTTGFDESRGLTEKDLQMAIISDYRVYMKMKKSDPDSRFYNMPLNEFEDRVKDALIKKYAGGDRAYGESLINNAIGEIAPEQIENYELDVRFTGPGPRDIRPSTGLPFDQQTLFRDPNQAAAVAQDFVAMPEVATQSNMAPSMVETAPVLSQPNVSSDTFASELMIDQQARRPTVGKNPNALDAPSEETGISSLPQSAPAREGSAVNTFMRNLFSPVGDAMRNNPLRDAITTGRNTMAETQKQKDLQEFFSETLANQQLAMPGGSIPRPGPGERESFENYLTPESMRKAETIQVGNMPYLYDRTSGTAYRVDGAPITDSEQASVDNVLKSDQSIEMLQAPIEASQQVQDKKITGSTPLPFLRVGSQEDLVFNMDPRKTTFRQREKERQKLEDLKNKPLVTEKDVGPQEPLVTEKEILVTEKEIKDPDADDPRKKLLGAEGYGAISLSNVENTSVTPGDPEATTLDFISNALGEPSDDPKKNVKSYEAQFREMLGIKDKDKAKEMWHNLSMIGFAIAAGRDPSALANIAQGMLEGTKMMKADRDAERKLDQDIALLALSERNKDKRLAAQLSSQETIAEMKKTSGFRNSRNPDEFAQNQYDNAFKQYGEAVLDVLGGRKPPADALPGETQEQYAARKGNLARAYAVGLLDSTEGNDTATESSSVTAEADPKIIEQIKEAKKTGSSDEKIKEQLIEKGHDPKAYGL